MAALTHPEGPSRAAIEQAPSTSGNPSAGGAVLSVRLFSDKNHIETGPDIWKSTDPAACLSLDLLVSSGGTLFETRGPALATRFSSIQAAILAARRLQWATQGLTDGVKESPIAPAVLVQSGEEAIDPAVQATLSQALEQAVSGQILVTAKVGSLLDEVAGFTLGVPSDTGLRELLWRGKEQQASRSADEKTITRIISEKGLTAEPETAAEGATSTDPGITRVDSGISRVVEIPRPAPLPVRQEIPEPDASIPIWKQKGKQIWLFGGAGAAVLALVVILIVHLSGSKPNSAVETATPSSQAPAAAAPATNSQPANATPRPQSSPTPALPRQAAKPQQANPLAAVPKGQTAQVPVKEPEKPPTQARGRCELDSGQIEQQIGLAERSLARGKYKDAQRQFDSVLACDGGNGRALNGLSRVHQAEAAEGNQ